MSELRPDQATTDPIASTTSSRRTRGSSAACSRPCPTCERPYEIRPSRQPHPCCATTQSTVCSKTQPAHGAAVRKTS